MLKTVYADFLYLALVLSTGFVLGVFRVLFVVSYIGERWAKLMEIPLMAAAIFFSAGYILRHFPEINFPRELLIVGFRALVLTVGAALGLAVALQSQSLAEHLGSRDKVSGLVYLVMLIEFALMQRLRLPYPKIVKIKG